MVVSWQFCGSEPTRHACLTSSQFPTTLQCNSLSAVKNVLNFFFRHPTTDRFCTFSYTPPATPHERHEQHGAEQQERTAWTSARRFRSRSFHPCFTSSARHSARRFRSRLRACSIAVAVACSSRNRRCSCLHRSSITRKRFRRCCCSSCFCCSGYCCSSCCCCTHPTDHSNSTL